MNAAESSDSEPGQTIGHLSGPTRPADLLEVLAARPLLPRGLLIIGGIAAALVAALGLRAFSDVIAPVFLGLVLSITVQPLRRLPARHGLAHWIGTLLSLVAVYAIVASLLFILVVSGVQLAGLLQDYAPQFQAFLTDVNQRLTDAGIDTSQIQAVTAQANPGKLIDLATQLLGGVAGILGSVSFLVLLLFFTVTDAAKFTANLARISPAGQRLADAFRLFATGSRRYLAVATVFGAVVAVLDVIALTILDIRYAWLWGLLAFVTNYIPNVGFIIGLLPPTVIALLDHNVGTALAVVIVYCVINIVLQSVIQPRVVGNTVGLSGTLSFLSLLVWTSILGGVGALLAVPASLFVKALFVDVDSERGWVKTLLSNSEPENTAVPEARSEPDPTTSNPAGS
jgi:AI-2 transport protein TqsA